jgi:hypothetical protein
MGILGTESLRVLLSNEESAADLKSDLVTATSVMDVSVVEALDKARETILPRERWTSHARARDEHGKPCHPVKFDACSWCVEGAVARACNMHGFLPAGVLRLLDAAATDVAGGGEVITSEINDNLGHRAALSLLILAREAAEYLGV